MNTDNKWILAVNEFNGFFDEIMVGSADDELKNQCGRMMTGFSIMTVTIEEDQNPDFLKLYDFAKIVHDSDFGEKDKRTIILMVLGIYENTFPEFYAKHQKDILLLFYDAIKAWVLNIDLLMLLKTVNSASLPFPKYIQIQALEIENILSYGGLMEDDYDDEMIPKLNELKLG